MVQLNYHHLYYFKTIATEGSISKAAIKLRLGQPTLSMQLKQFEEFLGHNLFERKSRSLVLTEMGRMVLGYANEIFRLGGEMMETISDRPTTKRAKLHIGALDSVPKALIRDIVAKAFEQGEVQVSVLEGEGPELLSELKEHRLDIVISNTAPPSSTEDHLFAKSISKMPLIVCGSNRFKNLNKNFPDSLQNQPFVFPTAHSRVRHEIEHFFEDEHLQVDVVAETQDTSLMKTLACDGHGLIVVAENAVRELLANGTLYKLGELENRFEEIWLVTAQRKIANPIAKVLMKVFVPQAAPELPDTSEA